MSPGKTAKPRLQLVRRKPAATPADAPPVATASFPQREGASTRQRVLFELVRARAAVHAAVQGLASGAADEPMSPGAWSVRETVLHLITRDQARLREMEAVLRGAKPTWMGIDAAAMDRVNAEWMEPFRTLEWEEALRLLHRTRHQLMDAVETIPEEPDHVWTEDHPFGWMLGILPSHDRHHAEMIKRWRTTRGA